MMDEVNDRDLRPFLDRARWQPAEVAFWLVVAGAFFVFGDYRTLGAQVLVMGCFALSLDLLLGFAGIVTLGQAAFFGIGAFVAGWLGKYGWHEPISGLAMAGLIAGTAGAITAQLIVRGTDLSRLMVTLGLGLVLYEAANKATHLTGGIDGLQGISFAPLFGVFEFDLYGNVAYVYAAVVSFVLLWVARRLVNSPYGMTLQAVRMNARRAMALGIDDGRTLGIAYTAAAVIAGISGALLTQITQFLTIDALGFNRSADILIIAALGGAGYLYGGFVGAAVFVIGRDLLSGISPAYWHFWLGLVLVLTIFFARGGIVGSGVIWARRLAARRGAER